MSAANPLLARRDDLLAELDVFPDAHARLEYLMERARDLDPLAPAEKTDANLVEGCMSNLWFVPSMDGDLCVFRCEADSLVVKSIAGLLCSFYSDARPADILALDPAFLAEAGITHHLSSNRRNALTRVWGRIQRFARDHDGGTPP